VIYKDTDKTDAEADSIKACCIHSISDSFFSLLGLYGLLFIVDHASCIYKMSNLEKAQIPSSAKYIYLHQNKTKHLILKHF